VGVTTARAAAKADRRAALLRAAARLFAERGFDRVEDAGEALRQLVTFHVAFAVGNADVIRVQDRDLDSLGDPDRRRVRTLQRTYVELWVDVLARLDPSAPVTALRARAHAAFGLMNSTPHSTAASPDLLASMALAALRA
jgi:AcrR family transcriptional regulator